jgi:undecaprenyl-diphosphatase
VVTVVALALAGWLVSRRRTAAAAYVLGRDGGDLGALAAAQGGRRPHPPVFDEPVATALGGSFPSGHTFAATAVCTCALLVLLPSVHAPRARRALLAVGVLVPLAVACTRVLLGVHYPTDVVGGLLVGAGWALACGAVLRSRR